MSDERTQLAIANLRASRDLEREANFVNIHTGAGTEDIWILLDHIAALEAELERSDPHMRIGYEPPPRHTIKAKLKSIERGENVTLEDDMSDERDERIAYLRKRYAVGIDALDGALMVNGLRGGDTSEAVEFVIGLLDHIAALEANALARDRQILDLVQPLQIVDTQISTHSEMLVAVENLLLEQADRIAALEADNIDKAGRVFRLEGECDRLRKVTAAETLILLDQIAEMRQRIAALEAVRKAARAAVEAALEIPDNSLHYLIYKAYIDALGDALAAAGQGENEDG